MIKFFQKLYIKFLLFRTRRHGRISPQGDSLIRYILKNYVNDPEVKELNEYYEDSITNFENLLRTHDYLAINKIDLTKEEYHLHAAYQMVMRILVLMPPQQRETYYTLIEDEEHRAWFRKTCNI